MVRQILIYTFIAFGLHGYSAVPLDSLFVSAVFKAEQGDCLRISSIEDIKKHVEHTNQILSTYSFTNDTIFIILNYDIEGTDRYYIVSSDIKLQADDNKKFEDATSWYSRELESSPELEWILNWETDSLTKYGVRSQRVHDGYYRTYVVRYIIKNDSVRADSVKYVPHIDMHFNCDKWRKQKYGY